MFHTESNRRLEVYDTVSDLAVADFDRKPGFYLRTADSTVWKLFPLFSAMEMDILLLSSGCAIAGQRTAITLLRFAALRSMPITAHGVTAWIPFGMPAGKDSVCHPASPDGRYLLLPVADYGTFPFGTGETGAADGFDRTGTIDSCQWSAQPFGHLSQLVVRQPLVCLCQQAG